MHTENNLLAYNARKTDLHSSLCSNLTFKNTFKSRVNEQINMLSHSIRPRVQHKMYAAGANENYTLPYSFFANIFFLLYICYADFYFRSSNRLKNSIKQKVEKVIWTNEKKLVWIRFRRKNRSANLVKLK